LESTRRSLKKTLNNGLLRSLEELSSTEKKMQLLTNLFKPKHSSEHSYPHQRISHRQYHRCTQPELRISFMSCRVHIPIAEVFSRWLLQQFLGTLVLTCKIYLFNYKLLGLIF
jgi:hypothetical protein